MNKRKRWTASEDYDELVAEVALLRKQQEEMHEMFCELLIAGNELRDKVCNLTDKNCTEVIKKWDDLTERFE